MSPAPTPTRLDRALRAFSDVRPGEGLTAMLLALNVFLILMSYYVLKPVREALILGQGSAELKSYMSVGQVLLLIVVVPLYGRLAASVTRIRLIRLVTWFFVGCLVMFYALAHAGMPIGVVYFLWIGIFSLMVVAQFWSFANDIYTKEAGERLFPIIGFGASLGAVLGSATAGVLIGILGIYQMLIVGAVGLVLQVLVATYVDHRESGRPTLHAATREPDPASSHNAFALVFRNPYLLGIGLMLLVFFLVDATGEYILGSIVRDRAVASVSAGQSSGLSVEELIGSFYSRYFGLVNGASLLLQLFLVSRIVKFFSVSRAVCVQPALACLAYSAIAFVPSLAFVLAAKVTEKSMDYSLNNTVRNMLFLPCTREEKYSAKQVIDSLFARLGDVISAGLVFVGTAMFSLSAAGFARVNILLALTGLGAALFVGRRYAQLSSHPTVAAPAAETRRAALS